MDFALLSSMQRFSFVLKAHDDNTHLTSMAMITYEDSFEKFPSPKQNYFALIKVLHNII